MKKKCLIVVFLINLVSGQEIPTHFFEHKRENFLYDSGFNWDNVTTLGGLRFQNSTINYTSGFRTNLNVLNPNVYFDSFGLFKFKKYFYSYYYLNFWHNWDKSVQNSENSYRDSFFNRQIILNSIDFSGIGFQNDWVYIQICKGREHWGAGNDIQLSLSEKSFPYDYFILGSDYGKIRVKYIHGILEKLNNKINRYITARGIEWTNNRDFVLGVSETVIYSGVNRAFEFSYSNPIASHLELELNNRLTQKEGGDANAIWQISGDILLRDKIRLSFNILFDEFVLDPDIEIGKEHGKAGSLKLVYPLSLGDKKNINVHTSLIYVGTPTFRHGKGFNNFVNKNHPLGWENGSDGYEIRIGFDFFRLDDIVANFSIGKIESGVESITYRHYEPYADYSKGDFPSGKKSKIIHIKTSLEYKLKNSFSIFGGINVSDHSDKISEKSIVVGINYSLSKAFGHDFIL